MATLSFEQACRSRKHWKSVVRVRSSKKFDVIGTQLVVRLREGLVINTSNSNCYQPKAGHTLFPGFEVLAPLYHVCIIFSKLQISQTQQPGYPNHHTSILWSRSSISICIRRSSFYSRTSTTICEWIDPNYETSTNIAFTRYRFYCSRGFEYGYLRTVSHLGLATDIFLAQKSIDTSPEWSIIKHVEGGCRGRPHGVG